MFELEPVEQGDGWAIFYVAALGVSVLEAQARTALPETAEKQETWWQRLIRRR